MMLGKYGASAGKSQFRFVRMRLRWQRAGYVIDREGVFVGGAKRFDRIFEEGLRAAEQTATKAAGEAREAARQGAIKQSSK